MKTTSLVAESASALALRREIGRFLRTARERGEMDCTRRQRARRRCQRSWPLLVTIEDQPEDQHRCVALHNASPSGIAFLCPQRIPPCTTVLIKLFWHDEFSPFVPAVVRHATRKLDGYIIGCAFVLSAGGAGGHATEHEMSVMARKH